MFEIGRLNVAGDSLGQVNVKVLDEQGVKILKKLTALYCVSGENKRGGESQGGDVLSIENKSSTHLKSGDPKNHPK